MATVLSGLAAAAEARGVERADVMIKMAEATGNKLDVHTMEMTQALLQLDSLPRAERRRLLGGPGSREVRDLIGELNAAWEGLRRKVGNQMEEAGAGELSLAVESGLVEVDPLLDEGDGDLEDLFEEFIVKLASVLAEGQAFPLFDDHTGSLIAAGISEGCSSPLRNR
jgi:hypothetical protein